MIIICKIHGQFIQNASQHQRGDDYPKCANIKKGLNAALPFKNILEVFNKKHNYKYDYSRAIYKNGFKKIEIICPIHGSFWQKPDAHKRKSGCPKCVRHKNFTQDMAIEVFIKKHGTTYDYSKVVYKNNHTKVIIICRVDGHGEFNITPNSHSIGMGCPKCAGNYRYTQNEIIERFEKVHKKKI